MVYTQFHCFSDTLGMQTTTNVLLPGPTEIASMEGQHMPTLYLLHGLSDDYTSWLRFTRIEQYARKYYVAVVMPSAARSFYTDMAYGPRYFTYVSQELPNVMESYFPLSKRGSDRFVAGLSMGGYGALKLALSSPHRYSSAASLSGCLEMQEAYQAADKFSFFPGELDNIFGSEEMLRSGCDNLWNLAQALEENLRQDSAFLPKFYVSCGTEDALLPANENFNARFGRALDIQYHTGPGMHSWDFWDAEMEKVLAWLPLQRLETVW